MCFYVPVRVTHHEQNQNSIIQPVCQRGSHAGKQTTTTDNDFLICKYFIRDILPAISTCFIVFRFKLQIQISKSFIQSIMSQSFALWTEL